jgi:hypothetical protein
MSKYWLVFRGAQATSLNSQQGRFRAWFVVVPADFLFWTFIILMVACQGAFASRIAG